MLELMYMGIYNVFTLVLTLYIPLGERQWMDASG